MNAWGDAVSGSTIVVGLAVMAIGAVCAAVYGLVSYYAKEKRRAR